MELRLVKQIRIHYAMTSFSVLNALIKQMMENGDLLPYL